MKILHAGESIKGGVATVLNELIDDQCKDEKINSIICIVPDEHKSELKIKDGVVGIYYKRNGRNLSSFINFLFSFIKVLLSERPDVVHLHSTFSGVLGRLPLFFLKPLVNCKVIYCPHAFSFMMNANKFKKKVYVLIEKFLLKITDAVICVSEYETKTALSYGFDFKKLHLIYNGISSNEKAKTRQNTAHPLNVLYVGRFDYQKGFDILRSTIEEVSKKTEGRIKFTLLGDFVTQNKEGDFMLPNTTFTGWLTKEQIAEYYQKADILVMPSRWEGFALVPIEAFSYGLPVIASDCSSLPEVVTDGYNGYLFETGSHEKLSEILLSIVEKDTRELLTSMSKNAVSTFMDKFTADKMKKLTKELYY